MKNIFKYSLIALVATVFSSFFISCEDDDLGSADRLFRPQINETLIGGTYFQVKWDRYQGAEKFELQLSVDSFKTVLRDIETDTTLYMFDALEYDTKYQLRIRSIGSNIQSEYFVSKDITTNDYPTKMITPVADDQLDIKVRVKWEDVNYDYFEVLSGDSVYATIPVTSGENAKKEIIITDLLPEKTYKIAAYIASPSGEGLYQGKKSYKTIKSPVLKGAIVDLRAYSDSESLNLITQSFIDSIATEYPGELITYVLNAGTTYNINNTVLFHSSVNFVPGLSFGSTQATFAIDNNFGIQPSITAKSVNFERIVFTDGPTKKKTDANFGGTYLFNFNSASDKCVIDSLTFNSCVIKYKRGVIRTQAEATLNTLIFNDCLIDSIGGYGVVNSGHDQAIVKDIIIKNSTISHSEKVLVGGKALSTNSILMDQVTVCWAPKGAGNYILDFNTNTVPGGIKLTKCLFGKGETTIRGIRSSASDITINQSYKASDLEWTLNAAGDAPMYPIDDLIPVKTTSVIFKNPTDNDYTIIDNDAKDKKAGDPRWFK